MVEFHDADWWGAELKRMLEEQRSEDLHLDYKDKGSLLASGRDKQKRAEDISKDGSSFLNSDGGVLVYGVPEAKDPNATGGAPIPRGPDIGFQRGDIAKETIENLITSSIQPRPGPDLFRVTEVPYDERVVFIVEVVVGIGDVWQAKDKRYYKRFSYKAEPMEHYEINMVRDRNLGPDLKLVFGFNDRWETKESTSEYLERRGDDVRVHIGIQNIANSVAESALIELGLYQPNGHSINVVGFGPFPANLYSTSFEPAGTRVVIQDNHGNSSNGIPVAWSRLFWNGANSRLAGRYAPVFKTETPIPVELLTLESVTVGGQAARTVSYCFWRIQAPNTMPRLGGVEIGTLPSFHPGPVCITELGTKFEIT